MVGILSRLGTNFDPKNLEVKNVDITRNLNVAGTSTFNDNSTFNNNVGIGVSNPIVSLDIIGNENITINSDLSYSSSGLDPYRSNSAIRIINANTDISGEGYTSIYLQNRSGDVAQGLISLIGRHFATDPEHFPGALTFGLRPPSGGGTITERMRIGSNGNVGIGTTSPTQLLDLSGDTIRLRNRRTIISSTAEGSAGEICFDNSYAYFCIADDSWGRVDLSLTWP